MKGQVLKRGENTWYLRIYLGEVDGKRKYLNKTVHGTKKQADTWLREWLREVETGNFVEPAKITVAQLLDRWLTDWATNNVGPTTQDRYETIIRVHLKPTIGHFQLQKLNVLLINELYAKKKAAGLQPSTIHVMHAVLDNALQAAVRWRLLAVNPADAAEVPRLEKGPVKVLLPDQAQAFLQTAEENRLYILVLLGLTTGMRLGEICALQWDDINFKAGTVSVRATMARTKENSLFRKTTKTKQSTRLVELSPKVVKALKSHKTAQARERLEAGEGWHDMGYVVCRPDGRPLWPQGVDRQLKSLFKKAGLPEYSSHVMRHTAATLMLAQGVHPKIVQERLGHSSIKVTLDLYSHVIPGMQRQAADRLEEMLFQKDGKLKEADAR